MAALAAVRGRMPVRRRIAAADLSAGHAHPQVHPGVADLEALLAAGDVVGELGHLDLVKDVSPLEAAYNDTSGVTERFVRNALDAVNRKLDATFEQSQFAYDARWDEEHEWMDIGLRARRAHTVVVGALELDVPFESGEPLRVEISAKFRRERVELESSRAGLHVDTWWTDSSGDFAIALLTREREGSL